MISTKKFKNILYIVEDKVYSGKLVYFSHKSALVTCNEDKNVDFMVAWEDVIITWEDKDIQ